MSKDEAVLLRARLRAIDDEFVPLMNKLLGEIDGLRVLALSEEAEQIEQRLAELEGE